MDETRFWEIIESAKNIWSKAEIKEDLSWSAFREELNKLSPAELIEFEEISRRLGTLIYTYELWAACHLLECGCSDDSFSDFRDWVIIQGKEIYYKALEDAEILAYLEDKTDGYYDIFLLSIISEVYRAKTGEELPEPLKYFKFELNGENWFNWEQEKLETRYPKLALRYKERENC